MTTTAVPRGRYGFRHAARMEWIKLRSLRSTWWVLALTVAGAVAIAVAVGVNTEDAAADLTNNALAGISLGLLLVGVLGVLAMTGEHSSGMIRATKTFGRVTARTPPRPQPERGRPRNRECDRVPSTGSPESSRTRSGCDRSRRRRTRSRRGRRRRPRGAGDRRAPCR